MYAPPMLAQHQLPDLIEAGTQVSYGHALLTNSKKLRLSIHTLPSLAGPFTLLRLAGDVLKVLTLFTRAFSGSLQAAFLSLG